MLKKRLIAGMAACLMAVSAFSMSASAYGQERMIARIYQGATVSSNSAKKTASGRFAVTPTPYGSDGWSSKGDEYVYFRGRTDSGEQATVLRRKSYNGTSSTEWINYLSGKASVGSYYKVAIEYDNTNPYEYVDLIVTWVP
ncbi:hypothetical protein [Hominenteromicrobium mulieris]|uniref:hypothetical protein n=1 Tax=Hominenteromicrobium mulieris TaxID=2885357 RepID=UPI00376F40D3